MKKNRNKKTHKQHRARHILTLVKKAYPDAWDFFEQYRQKRCKPGFISWPDWCYAPLRVGIAYVNKVMNMPVHAKDYNDPYLITAMCTWRMTQGVYRFDPTLMAEILRKL